MRVCYSKFEYIFLICINININIYIYMCVCVCVSVCVCVCVCGSIMVYYILQHDRDKTKFFISDIFYCVFNTLCRHFLLF